MIRWTIAVSLLVARPGAAGADGVIGSGISDYDVGVGVWSRPGADAALRLDAGVTVLTTRDGSAPDATAWRRDLDLELRVGGLLSAGADHLDGGAFRPQLVLAGALRPPADPGARMTADAYRVDLSIAGLFGSYTGAEAGIDLHVVPWGGLYARAGYLWDPVPGPIISGGIRLDGLPARLAIGTVAITALVVLVLKGGFYYQPDG